MKCSALQISRILCLQCLPRKIRQSRVREKGAVEVQAVGAGAVNQTVKSIAIARGYVAPNGIDLVCIPAFAKITIDDEERTAIKFQLESR